MIRIITISFVLAAALVVLAADEPKLPIRSAPNVPAKTELPPKDFTETIEEGIKIPDEKDPDKFTMQKTSVKLEMVYVTGGEFQMGSPAGEDGRDINEGPIHKVAVGSFWIAKFETSWELFDCWYLNQNLPKRDESEEAYTRDNGGKALAPDAITRPTLPHVPDNYEHGREGHPAISMSHHSAMVFCHWLRGKTKRGYRLPTEAEWEFACRAGKTGPYGFEGDKDRLGDYAWFKGNSKTEDKPEGTTHKIGTKKPNAFGLYDMHGNVAEWCLDQYDTKIFEKRSKDPTVLTFVKPTEAKWSHVVRGGSWMDPAEKLRSAARCPSKGATAEKSPNDWMKEDPQFPRGIWWLTNMDTIGFRVALPVEEYPELVGLKPSVIKKGF